MISFFIMIYIRINYKYINNKKFTTEKNTGQQEEIIFIYPCCQHKTWMRGEI